MIDCAPNKYPVQLTDEQRQRLQDIARNGHAPAQQVRHAQVLLLSDHGRPGGHKTEPEIAEALDRHRNTVARIRKRFVLEGELPALERKPPVPPKVDGRVEAHLVAGGASVAATAAPVWTGRRRCGGCWMTITPRPRRSSCCATT